MTPLDRHIMLLRTSARFCRPWRDNEAPLRSPRRRTRRPSLKRQIAAAERSGKRVTSITTPDGLTLHFDKTENTEASNPWLADLNKVTKQ